MGYKSGRSAAILCSSHKMKLVFIVCLLLTVVLGEYSWEVWVLTWLLTTLRSFNSYLSSWDVSLDGLVKDVTFWFWEVDKWVTQKVNLSQAECITYARDLNLEDLSSDLVCCQALPSCITAISPSSMSMITCPWCWLLPSNTCLVTCLDN